jgi:hypothetical protein
MSRGERKISSPQSPLWINRKSASNEALSSKEHSLKSRSIKKHEGQGRTVLSRAIPLWLSPCQDSSSEFARLP